MTMMTTMMTMMTMTTMMMMMPRTRSKVLGVAIPGHITTKDVVEVRCADRKVRKVRKTDGRM